MRQAFDAASRLSAVNYAYWNGNYVGANHFTVNVYDSRLVLSKN